MNSMPVLIGTSGWQYRDRRGELYPAGVAQRRWLEHYATQYATVENNSSFYRLPAPETFAGWRARTPDDFVMTVKASRYLVVQQILAAHDAALCWADRLGRPVTPLWRTAGWGYLRFHEGAADPWPCYGQQALRSWADRLRQAWPGDADVYVYFNNDPGGAAVVNSAVFAALGLTSEDVQQQAGEERADQTDTRRCGRPGVAPVTTDRVQSLNRIQNRSRAGNDGFLRWQPAAAAHRGGRHLHHERHHGQESGLVVLGKAGRYRQRPGRGRHVRLRGLP
jgi:uncharacterized protein YecE (DUF72 family)